MTLRGFHPAVAAWFERTFAAPTEPQARAWPAILARQHTLIAAPTGSGKTLSAFLAAIDALVCQGLDGGLEDATQVVYVSPLKALSNDIQRNLQLPLAGIREELRQQGLPDVEIRTLVRTGDTPAAERQAMIRRPPHIVVTTPESLYILLTSRRGRDLLATTRSVIVDEIHALVGNKRGSHLALSLERLAALAGPGLVRVGLSATQRPIEDVARFLVGTRATVNGAPECTIVDSGHRRDLDLAIEMPASPLEAVMSGEVWTEIHDRLATLIAAHRTTLVFVNTRRLAERLTRHLAERLGEDRVTSHHGSLAREQRLRAEERLKKGELSALVATASLELGIDIGDVDLVCQIGSTRAIATFVQRVGRSGHAVGALPKGRVFPQSRDELVECVALLDAVRRGELDRLTIPSAPLDILAQQIVAEVASREWREDELFDLVRGAYPYRDLARQDFEDVVSMLAEGFSTRRGRRSAHVHRDAVNGRLRGRRGARLVALTSGGAIPDTADYQVVLEPSGAVIGTLNEDFAIESMAGDIFQLGNASWLILRIEPGKVRVADAQGQPPTVPFWLGEAPSRTRELSAAVSRLRGEIASDCKDPDGLESARRRLEDLGAGAVAARQVADYLFAAQAALGVVPTQRQIVLERFFDEAGGMQLVLHAPFGARLNRAWGLALRKRFCRKFNFELQAAATEDAIVLSLGPTHSFPLAEVFEYLSPATVRDVLTQALLDAPMFEVRWRWNAGRALAVPRFRGGRKVPAPLLRMQAADLLTVVFPDQVACAENLSGAREVPDHPLVAQTIRDCLEEAMDLAGLEDLLRAIERGDIELVARDVVEPSPLAQEILSARPYAFLDDAPLEERRTQAVQSRRWLDPESANDLGALDPEAVRRVRAEAWPEAENADELHDALVLHAFLTVEEGHRARATFTTDTVRPGARVESDVSTGDWRVLFATLVAERRACVLHPCDGVRLWVAAERLPQFEALFPGVRRDPAIEPPDSHRLQAASSEEALVEILRGRLEGTGPITMHELVRPLGVTPERAETAIAALETEGFVLRGRFDPALDDVQWCERRLLARMHRYTLKRLRAEIEPVATADFLRFLLAWQRVLPHDHATGAEGLAAVLEQLEGFEAPAAAWESDVLPARVERYDPAWLDAQCVAGRVLWARRSLPRPNTAATVERDARPGPVRSTPIVLLQRRHLAAWETFASSETPWSLSPEARCVEAHLRSRGAAFYEEIVGSSGLLRTQVETALAELVAAGRATSDSFLGLRALLVPSSERRPLGGVRRRRRTACYGIEDAGRWAHVRHPNATTADGIGIADETAPTRQDRASAVEIVARLLLRRWGVVFRKLIDREAGLPPWRELLHVYHRLEARGEIRGGRFVAGPSGEQFALPEAVAQLREVRRAMRAGELVAVSGADPLNLTGILLPGARLPAIAGNRILYRDGVPIAVREAGEIRILEDLDSTAAWEARQALVRRPGTARAPVLRARASRGAA